MGIFDKVLIIHLGNSPWLYQKLYVRKNSKAYRYREMGFVRYLTTHNTTLAAVAVDVMVAGWQVKQTTWRQLVEILTQWRCWVLHSNLKSTLSPEWWKNNQIAIKQAGDETIILHDVTYDAGLGTGRNSNNLVPTGDAAGFVCFFHWQNYASIPNFYRPSPPGVRVTNCDPAIMTNIFCSLSIHILLNCYLVYFRFEFHNHLFLRSVQLVKNQYWFWWRLCPLFEKPLLQPVLTQFNICINRPPWVKCCNSGGLPLWFRNQIWQAPGGRLNKKDGLTRYGNSHVKDKTS